MATRPSLYYKPGDTSQNFTNVTFSDHAPQSILLANGPYTNGTYQPSNLDAAGNSFPFSGLNGSKVNGQYTLTIDNYNSINSGTLLNWSITVDSTKLAMPQYEASPQIQVGAPMDQNADGTFDQNPLTTPFTGLVPGDAYVAPMPQPTAPFTFNASTILSPPFDSNTLPLIFPGPYVASTSVPNGAGSSNEVLNGTNSSINLTFDRPIQAGTVTPGQVLSIMGPVGPITGPQSFSSNNTLQTIPAASGTGSGSLQNSLTVTSLNGTFTIAKITVQLSIAAANDSSLTAVLIAPDGTQVPLFSGVGGTGTGFVNTTFDDAAETSITTGTAPFTGTFRPTGQLSSLDGKTVDMKNPADTALWEPGVWKLVVTNKAGSSGILENWSLNITPVISVAPQSPSSTVNVAIPAMSASGPGVLNSQVIIPSSSNPGNVDSSLHVQLNITNTNNADLSALLIAPDGTQVSLFAAGTLSGSNLTKTVISDGGTGLISAGTAPYTGTFKPEDPKGLAQLIGKNLAGTWTLRITNTATGVTSTLVSWSLVTSKATYAAQVATTFTISFPQQELSGTYTIEMGPDASTSMFPLDQAGDAVDTSLDAGLGVLRGGTSTSPVTTVQYASSDLPKVIPPPAGSTAGQVTSTIIVPDSFMVQGDSTSSGVSGLRVTINLTYPHDPDLTITLQHFDLNGNPIGSVPLATNVGSGSNQTANFTNTVFDDNATTPIQNGGAPFFATFNPQIPLSTFAGMSAQGTWVLTIQNSATGSGGTGTINSWSLSFQKPLPTSGLGVPGADNINASFRIFNLGQADAMSAQAWTPVGPASISGTGSPSSSAAGSAESATGARSGRVTGLAVDPSDPTGNTVYAAGASGGVWKTTDFLTTNPAGPNWISLTDFGPSNAINIGSIAVFPRNDNVNDTVIIAATGEGNTGTPGVGFLISMNGGATWTLDDSSVNVDSSGNPLPIETTNAALARNRTFVGDTAYQVVVDPKLSPSGGIIIYAALSGPTGGIWRSEDAGAHWTNMLPGQATSVVLDADSGVTLNPDTDTAVQGNLQVVFAGIEGVGVEMSPNQGQVWSLMAGGIGNPLIINDFTAPAKNVNPAAGPTPNGAEGRVVLAVPAQTGNAVENSIYAGWLYAAVATPAGGLFGLFETKDFGQNWTDVKISSLPAVGTTDQAIPTNDVTQPNYPITGGGAFGAGQGNYDLILDTDPTNPNVVYLGGSLDGGQTALARVDTTNIWDAHSLVPYDSFAADGGAVSLNSKGPAPVNSVVDVLPPVFLNFVTGFDDPTYYENFIRSPAAPFLANSTLDVFDYASFTNNGAGVTWIPFDPGGTDYHSVTAMVDPLTGLPRLIFGNDQGVWSILDNNGTFETQLGASGTGAQLGSPTAQLAGVDRNGNLDITQFYYGATQPSTAAAEIAGAMFYGSAQDDGGPVSDPNIITNGNITWSGPGGDATGVGTDQQVAGNGLPVLLALLRRRGYRLFPVHRARLERRRSQPRGPNRRRLRWPDLRPAPGEQRLAGSRSPVAIHRRRQFRRRPGQQR